MLPDDSIAFFNLFKITSSSEKNRSQMIPLNINNEALAWRIALIEQAEKTIGAQLKLNKKGQLSGRVATSQPPSSQQEIYGKEWQTSSTQVCQFSNHYELYI